MTATRRFWWAASLVWWTTAIAAFVAGPVSVLAATPIGAGGEPTSAPSAGPIDLLLNVLPALAAITGGVVIAILLATAVAAIGGPAGSAPANGSRATPAWRRPWFFAIGGPALVIGVLCGRAIAYSASQGGLSVLGAGILVVLVGAVVVVLCVIAVVATTIRRGHVSGAIVNVFAAAGLLAAGTLGGSATAAATGGLYHATVVLEAPGETIFRLDSATLPFASRGSGEATCQSDPDGRTVVGILALQLGELGPGTLRANISLPVAASEPATAEFFVDAGDLPEGSVPPSWNGRILVSGVSTDHASGRLAFDALPRASMDKLPDDQSSAAVAVGKIWPPTISGEMTWSCQAWS